MTEEDKYIIETIATKVMGYVTNGNCDLELFNPLLNEEHCMEAWEKFSKDNYSYTMLTHARNKEQQSIWKARCYDIHAFHPDRKRAICMCMVKQVTRDDV